MNKISIKELLNIDFKIVDSSSHGFEIDNIAEEGEDAKYSSGGFGDITLESPCGIKLVYYWEADGGDGSYKQAYQFDLSISENEMMQLIGVELDLDVDRDLYMHMEDDQAYFELCSDILNKTDWENEVNQYLPKPHISKIDDASANVLDEDRESSMSKHTLNPSGSCPLEFFGEIIGEVKSSWDTADPNNYSGDSGAFEYLTLYKTNTGKYVCSNYLNTRWADCCDQHKVVVCETIDEVIAFFGDGWLAKSLYVEAEIIIKEVA